MIRALLLLALAIGTTAADAQMVSMRASTAPRVVPFAYVEQIAPPAEYRVWYDDMRACSGLDGPPFETIEFWIVDAPTFLMEGHRVAGWGDKPNRTVWLARYLMSDRTVVSHELLHILLGVGHPQVPGTSPCGVW